MNLSRHNRFCLPCTQLLILLLLGLLATPLCADPNVGDRAPGWRMNDVDDETLRFPQEIDSDYSLVVFWASWCPYCKALMPRLASLQQEIGADRLPVLALRLEVPDGNGDSMLVPEGFPDVRKRLGCRRGDSLGFDAAGFVSRPQWPDRLPP